MKLIFSEKFYSVYTRDPAADRGRLEPTINKIRNDNFYEFIEPKKADTDDILRAHSKRHYQSIKSQPIIYNMARLAAGGAIFSAEISFNEKTSTFALIRPPGHHASADSCWGFCFFNNMSIALLKLKSEGRINSAFILDFDLHTGDGNINILGNDSQIHILNPTTNNEVEYLENVRKKLDSLDNIDIICASAGFDNAIGDWGGTLSTEAYRNIGRLLKQYSIKLCEGRRFALLEGGYNYDLMPTNFDAFCKNFG